MKDQQCPWCKKLLKTSATGIKFEDGKLDNRPIKPSNGSLCLCVQCGEWAVFGKHLKLRKPKEEEWMSIGFSPDCQIMRATWVAWMEHKKERENELSPP